MTVTAEVRELPILMHARSVRGILEERKSQTRRIVKGVDRANQMVLKKPTKTRGGTCTHVLDAPGRGLCPYGAPGDRLYVREGWRPKAMFGDEPAVMEYRADGGWAEVNSSIVDERWDEYAKWEDRQLERLEEEAEAAGLTPDHDGMYHWEESPLVWRPSIHMPKWAARIWLEVTGVRVERVQEISEEDARAEGCTIPAASSGLPTLHHAWRALWNQTNGHRDGCTWEDNPWVWVIEFRRIER